MNLSWLHTISSWPSGSRMLRSQCWDRISGIWCYQSTRSNLCTGPVANLGEAVPHTCALPKACPVHCQLWSWSLIADWISSFWLPKHYTHFSKWPPYFYCPSKGVAGQVTDFQPCSRSVMPPWATPSFFFLVSFGPCDIDSKRNLLFILHKSAISGGKQDWTRSDFQTASWNYIIQQDWYSME